MIPRILTRQICLASVVLAASAITPLLLADDIYFSTGDPQPFYGQLWRANIDGSGAQMIQRREAEFGIAEVEFNPSDGMVYWSEHYQGLWRSARDGSNRTQLLSTITSLDVHGIAFDQNFIDWSLGAINDGTGRGLWRASLGTLTPQSVFVNSNWSDDLAIDPITKKVYWTDPAECSTCPGAVWRADRLGTTKESVASFTGFPRGPHDVWVDAALGKLYWSHDGIHRSSLDSSGVETIVADEVNSFAFTRSGDAVFYSLGAALYRADRNGQNATLLLTADRAIEQISVDAASAMPEPSQFVFLATVLLANIFRRYRYS